ncbi:hypothetical protein SARC_13699 [Sphaeroforma arctica JP610]|uniref:Roadblock/LAMTOR2 domain-containing protein n=1 Tax=Sphaeroforma arctica JP610 TaxID=667725 RepID=A0A0L0FB64_9EUKA|nr:hypothetical protein SARC_13699 [Sphaeroforma arctica JP610]KNC73741.1 hypothetical protein SARC_13699 [Sphaeroforma arctica JP610]|eukprot:XP_014147643.1 hypothetical protein SARC_13699 [Sphaeroforma arctica JP610]
MFTLEEVEEKIQSLSSSPGVVGVAVFRCNDGALISSSFDTERLPHFVEMGQNLLRQGDAMSQQLQDPLTYIRLRMKSTELLVSKDGDHGFLLVRSIE